MATRKSTPRVSASRKTPAPPAVNRQQASSLTKRRSAKPVETASTVPAATEPVKTKHKLVRDSFTIPKNEYAVLGELKQRAAQLARPVKKSELLRAGINALRGMADKAFLSALDAVPSLKTGRPKDSDSSAGKGTGD